METVFPVLDSKTTCVLFHPTSSCKANANHIGNPCTHLCLPLSCCPESKAVANLMCIAFSFVSDPVNTPVQQLMIKLLLWIMLPFSSEPGTSTMSTSLKTSSSTNVLAAHFHRSEKQSSMCYYCSHLLQRCLVFPSAGYLRQLLLHHRVFWYLNIPLNRTIKLASYYKFWNVNVPIKAFMITQIIRVHAIFLESNSQYCSKEPLSLIALSRECNDAAPRRVRPKCYKIDGALEQQYDDVLLAPAIATCIPKPGSQNVQQWHIYVLIWWMGFGYAWISTHYKELIFSFLSIPRFCSRPVANWPKW